MTTTQPLTLAELREVIERQLGAGAGPTVRDRAIETLDRLEASNKGLATRLSKEVAELDLASRRARNREADLMLGRRIPVLDQGYVQFVDYMGTDEEIVRAARTSYGEGTKKVRGPRDLIRYLLRKWHTSPFEMAELKVQVRVPMDAWRQWIRHRTANVNEYSTRYSVAIDAAQRTDPDAWRLQDAGNRQGSDGFLDEETGRRLSDSEERFQRFARDLYEERIELGVAREQARKDLPLSTYTVAVWKIDAHNLLHFLRLRCDPHAQKEIRAFADALATIVKVWLPLTWEAFEDYRLNTVTFTGPELEVVGQFLALFDGAADLIIEGGFEHRLTSRERKELVEKLEKLKPAREWRHVDE